MRFGRRRSYEVRPALRALVAALVSLSAAPPASASPPAVTLVAQHGLGEACLDPQLALGGAIAACTLGATRRVVVWDVASGTILRELDGADAPLALSADGALLAVRRRLAQGAIVELHDLEAGRVRATFDRAGFLGAAAFSPDGLTLAYEADGAAVVLRSTVDGRLVTTLPKRGKPLVFVGASALLTWPELDAKPGAHPEVFEVAGGRTRALDAKEIPERCAPACAPTRPFRLITSTGGRRAVGLFPDREIWWDTSTGRVDRVTRGELAPVSAVSEDGREAWTFRGAKLVHLTPSGPRILASVPGLPELMSRDGRRALVSPDWRLPAAKRDPATMTLWDVRAGALLTRYPSGIAGMRGAAFAAGGARLATTTLAHGVHVWDLATLASLRHLPVVGATEVALSSGGETAAAYRGNAQPFASLVWSVDTGALRATFPLRSGPVVPHVRDLWLGPGGGALTTWDGTLRRRAVPSGAVALEAAPNDALTRDPDAFASTDAYFYQVAQSDAERTIFRVRQSDGGGHATVARGIPPVPRRAGLLGQTRALAVSRDDRLAALSDQGAGGHLVVWDLAAGARVRDLSGPRPFEAIALSDDGELLAAGDSAGAVRVWKARAGDLLFEVSHQAEVQRVRFAPGGKLVVSVGRDEVVRVSSLATRQSVSLLTDGPEWLAYTDDGFFGASQGGGRSVAAVRGLRSYAVDQLAARLNRPDRVLERLGLGSPELLEHYRAMHERRLRRLGLEPSETEGRLELAPTARIVSTEPKDGAVTVRADLAATAAELLRYNVYVNGVPQLGALGKPVRGARATVSERVELSSGENRVEVTAMDRGGVESLRDSRLVSSASARKPEIYYVGFGASRYRDARFNLAYAHKDVLDVGHYVRSATKGFAAAHVQTFVDGQVTKASIVEAKKLLEGATVDDTLVVFVAGHGTWSRGASADYYFLTHDFDPAHIEQTAASFSLIEDLLRDVRPRRKLLLLDTCESGERDPKELESTRVGAGARGLVARAVRGFGLATATATAPPRRHLFDRQRYIYNDLSRRSGAIVLSSSQGSELSYERDDLQNGVFTEHVLAALTSDVADADKDGIVTDRELRSYVASAVAKDTGGLQHPSVDRDNPLAVVGLPVLGGLEFPKSYPRTPAAASAEPTPRVAQAPVPPPRSARGCGCDVAPSRELPGLPWALALALVGARRVRARRPRAATALARRG